MYNDHVISRGNHPTELLPYLWYFRSFNPLVSVVACALWEAYGGVGNWRWGSFDKDILSMDKHSHSIYSQEWTVMDSLHSVMAAGEWRFILLADVATGFCLCPYQQPYDTVWICWVIKRRHDFGGKCFGRAKERELEENLEWGYDQDTLHMFMSSQKQI